MEDMDHGLDEPWLVAGIASHQRVSLGSWRMGSWPLEPLASALRFPNPQEQECGSIWLLEKRFQFWNIYPTHCFVSSSFFAPVHPSGRKQSLRSCSSFKETICQQQVTNEPEWLTAGECSPWKQRARERTGTDQRERHNGGSCSRNQSQTDWGESAFLNT